MPAESANNSKKFVVVFVTAILACVIAVVVYVWMGRIPAQPGMLYVPEGNFHAGAEKKTTQLNAFYMDETEVTNADFAEFCRAISPSTTCVAPTGAPDLPVVNITVAQARAFAQWKGKRLPTSQEWERTARGIDGDRYPWGDADDASGANLSDNPKAAHALMPVKSFKRMPAYQMAGNAWEMVDAPATADASTVEAFLKFAGAAGAQMNPPPSVDEKWIQIRGGSFQTPVASAVASAFVAIPERYAAADIGFRCAKTP
jgi:eukaryotic-like serine/threonine-protein kinase